MANMIQWKFQDPKMEVLYHIRPYVVGIFPYIGLRYLKSIGSCCMAIEGHLHRVSHGVCPGMKFTGVPGTNPNWMSGILMILVIYPLYAHYMPIRYWDSPTIIHYNSFFAHWILEFIPIFDFHSPIHFIIMIICPFYAHYIPIICPLKLSRYLVRR